MQNNEQKSLKLHVYGLVQGVGFRPYVAELCKELSVAGTVRNSGGIVIIEASGAEASLASLREKLEALDGKNPVLPGARVDLIEEEPWACADASEVDEVMPSEGAIESPVAEMHLVERSVGEMRIVESDSFEESVRFLPPDIATCPRCEKELLDPANRRYRYPFISCFSCGPRYTIMDAVPYDREHTTMKAFPLCKDCEKDYEEFGNPRHFAQTIACEKCGPKLMAYELAPAGLTAQDETDELISSNCGVKKTAEGDAAFARAVEVLKSGGVVAVKDIGGYHLAFDPYNEETAQRLRALKHRERKPFAVMFPDVDSIRNMCEVNEKEEELITSDARPIVLLRKRDLIVQSESADDMSAGGSDCGTGEMRREFAPGVCGASDNIGAMLPCNPLQILLLKECGPLVMTSANRGGEPMIIDDDKMCEMLKSSHRKNSNVENDGENNIGAIYESEGIDLVLANDREILQGLDDSVCQVFGDKVQFIRRARGYVPTPIILKHELEKETFAAGGDLKSVFAFSKKRFAYLSGHYGDLEEYAAYLAMQNGVKHFKDLFGFHEEQIVYDMHPSYASSKYAKELINSNNASADSANIVGTEVQHHHAHVASVIAEHGLEGKVLGVAFDGTGYGTDGTIWGGEFLLCETTRDEATGKYNHRMKRFGHLKSVEMTGGDAMAKNANIPAACYLHEVGEKYGDAVVLSALDNHINTVKNSSAGRLFDAVAAVLDLCHENSYEGECPNVLQTAAERFAKTVEGDTHTLVLHTQEDDGKIILDTPRFVADIYHKKQSGVSTEQLAYEFHVALAESIAETIVAICKKHEVVQVVFSGGTFYNRLLLKEIYNNLSGKNLKLYINEHVPSGDGGLALGQLFLTL